MGKVKWYYSNRTDIFKDEFDDVAEQKFVKWINVNTPYRGLIQYVKHRGYYHGMIDKDGYRYEINGMNYLVYDPDGNYIKTV